MTLSTHHIEVPHGHLYAERRGRGFPLLLLHGHTLSGAMWDAQLEAWSTHFTVVQPDLRGYGRSSLPHPEFSYADDLRRLLDALGLERAHVLGLSLGGNVALELAWRFPQRVGRLVLAASSLRGFAVPADFVASLSALNDLARTQGVEAARARWLEHPLFASLRRDPAQLEYLRALTRGYSGWHWLHAVSPSAWLDLGLHDDLERIAAPSLVLIGELDLPHNHAIAEALCARLPHASGVGRQGAGHMLNLEQPEWFGETVLRFLER